MRKLSKFYNTKQLFIEEIVLYHLAVNHGLNKNVSLLDDVRHPGIPPVLGFLQHIIRNAPDSRLAKICCVELLADCIFC